MTSRKQKIQGLVQVPNGYYDVEFEPLDEGGYLARVPALESSTFGKTFEQAQDMVADMVAGWLDVARADGLPIPEPKPLILIASHIAVTQ
jgi:predicted RNase H-like HicB family nuclease